MYDKFGQFINGKWQKSSTGETYEVINPATEEILGKASKASIKEIELSLLNLLKKVFKFGKIHLHGKDQKLLEKFQNLLERKIILS